MGNWPVDAVGPEAARQLSHLHEACFPNGEAWSAPNMRNLLAMPGCCAWVVATDNGLAGMVVARKALDEAEILTICVAPDYRRRGVAQSLIERMSESMKRAKVEKIFLEVRADNVAARSLYMAAGYNRCGFRANYYSDGGNAIVMCANLSDSL